MAPHLAVLIAIVAGAALGFVFAARAGPFIALGLFVLLWRGVSTGALIAGAGALLLLVVPVLTLAIGVDDPGGYNPEYPVDRLAVHWVAVAAVIAADAGTGAGARCSATPATTSVTPASSAADGTWASTMTPITVAVAGSSETISA